MRFSEWVVLGSTLIQFKPEIFLQNNCGCFIGMAGAAQGESYLGGQQGTGKIEALFPWIMKDRCVDCPGCGRAYSTYSQTISCVAYHVHLDDMTFEEALAYFRSIEPAEEVDTPDTSVPVWNRYSAVKV